MTAEEYRLSASGWPYQRGAPYTCDACGHKGYAGEPHECPEAKGEADDKCEVCAPVKPHSEVN